MKHYDDVDAFLASATRSRAECEALRTLVRKAITVQKQGLTLPKRPKLVLVAELQARLDADPG